MIKLHGLGVILITSILNISSNNEDHIYKIFFFSLLVTKCKILSINKKKHCSQMNL